MLLPCIEASQPWKLLAVIERAWTQQGFGSVYLFMITKALRCCRGAPCRIGETQYIRVPASSHFQLRAIPQGLVRRCCAHSTAKMIAGPSPDSSLAQEFPELNGRVRSSGSKPKRLQIHWHVGRARPSPKGLKVPSERHLRTGLRQLLEKRPVSPLFLSFFSASLLTSVASCGGSRASAWTLEQRARSRRAGSRCRGLGLSCLPVARLSFAHAQGNISVLKSK